MDFRRTLQRILRIIWAYAAVGMILLICLCVGLWSALEASVRVTNEALHNIFQRRRNVFIESNDETLKEELQTSPKSTKTASDDTTSECTSSQTYPKFSDPTERRNTTASKTTDEQTKDNFSNLEGLALQMAHLERHRMSTDLPRRTSPSEACVRSPNDSVNETAPKSVLKSSCSKTVSPTSTRGTRRIRFQDEPFYEVGKTSYAGFTSSKKPVSSSLLVPKPRRKLLPAAHLKAGLNFQESPDKSPGTKSCVTEQSTEALQTENAPMVILPPEIASNQQLAKEGKEHLSEESDPTIPVAMSSKTYDNQQIAIDSISEDSKSTILTALEIATDQQLASESEGCLSEELNLTDPSALSPETATNMRIPNKSMDFLSEDLNSSVPLTFKEFEESSKVGDQCFDQRVESTLKLKEGEKICLEQTYEEISTKIKVTEVDELRCESSVNEKKASSSENEESSKKGGTDDIRELPGKSETVTVGENVEKMNLLSESICQQSTKELLNENRREFTSDELNSAILKNNEELRKSIESEDHFKLESMGSTVVTDHKEESREMTQTLNKMDVENLRDDSSEKRDMTSSSDEEACFKKEGKDDVSQALKTIDNDVLQSEVAADQQSAEESTYLQVNISSE